jgi:hypothetical protein
MGFAGEHIADFIEATARRPLFSEGGGIVEQLP